MELDDRRVGVQRAGFVARQFLRVREVGQRVLVSRRDVQRLAELANGARIVVLFRGADAGRERGRDQTHPVGLHHRRQQVLHRRPVVRQHARAVARAQIGEMLIRQRRAHERAGTGRPLADVRQIQRLVAPHENGGVATLQFIRGGNRPAVRKHLREGLGDGVHEAADFVGVDQVHHVEPVRLEQLPDLSEKFPRGELVRHRIVADRIADDEIERRHAAGLLAVLPQGVGHVVARVEVVDFDGRVRRQAEGLLRGARHARIDFDHDEFAARPRARKVVREHVAPAPQQQQAHGLVVPAQLLVHQRVVDAHVGIFQVAEIVQVRFAVAQLVLVERAVRGIARLRRHGQDLILGFREIDGVVFRGDVAQLQRARGPRRAGPRQHREQEKRQGQRRPGAGRAPPAPRGERIEQPQHRQQQRHRDHDAHAAQPRRQVEARQERAGDAAHRVPGIERADRPAHVRGALDRQFRHHRADGAQHRGRQQERPRHVQQDPHGPRQPHQQRRRPRPRVQPQNRQARRRPREQHRRDAPRQVLGRVRHPAAQIVPQAHARENDAQHPRPRVERRSQEPRDQPACHQLHRHDPRPGQENGRVQPKGSLVRAHGRKPYRKRRKQPKRFKLRNTRKARNENHRATPSDESRTFDSRHPAFLDPFPFRAFRVFRGCPAVRLHNKKPRPVSRSGSIAVKCEAD